MNRNAIVVFVNLCVVIVLIGLMAMQPISAATVSHEGAARVKTIDMEKGIVKLAHVPIASLKWPAMTMDFKFKDSALMQGINVGDAVTFTFVESNGDYVVTHIKSSQ